MFLRKNQVQIREGKEGVSSRSLMFQPFASASNLPVPAIARLGGFLPAGQDLSGELPIEVAVAADPNPAPIVSAA